MSCRSTRAGTLATRLARHSSGLPDGVITRLFHALKREAAGLPEPTADEIETMRFTLREQLDGHNLPASQVERSERDLLLARDENFDAATLHALVTIDARARQESVIRSVKGMVADLEAPGSQADQYEIGEDGRPTKVWYASYGSNLNRARFMTYIEGGSPEGSTATHPGCRDTTAPLEDTPIRFGGRMHFAASSGRWDGGGVAFMDVDNAGHALGRAYLLNIAQFDDVVAQENGKKPGELTVKTDELLKAGKSDVTYGLYGTAVHIGDYHGAPVFTFTSDFTAQEALERSKTRSKTSYGSSTNAPSGNYLRMIGGGLEESFGMSKDEQADYLRGSLGMDERSREETLTVLNTPWEAPKPVKYSTRSGGMSSSWRTSAWDDYGYGTGKYKPWWEQEEEARATRSRTSKSYLDDWGDEEPGLFDSDWYALGRGEYDDTPPMTDDGLSDDGFTFAPVKTSRPPRAYSYKRCVICDSTAHSMHDCPDLFPEGKAS